MRIVILVYAPNRTNVLSGARYEHLCNLSFEGYAGGARIENVCVKVYGVMKSSYMKTLEIMESFEKV